MKKIPLPRIETGVRNLDALLMGGLPKGSVSVFGGSPGAGKTILAQQIAFHHASRKQRVLWFGTLSEPTAKILRYASQFAFFDRARLDAGELQFVDLGVIVRAKGLSEASKLIKQHVKDFRPSLVVIDSFKVFDDLATSREEQRKFSYDLAVHLMAWETTAFLLGEYGPSDLASNPMFSIVDGLVLLTHGEQAGEPQRFLQILKMRGTDHSREQHPFVISSAGIEVFAPRITIQRNPRADLTPVSRVKTGIAKLDDLLGDGIPRGSSVLVAGTSGTGKTVLLLEFLYRGALAGEKGIIFSFEESEERLRATAHGLGWNLDAEIQRGMVEIVSIPQPNILVEGHVLMMKERIEAMGARRVAIDSLSVFLHKLADASSVGVEIFQLATIVQNSGAVGFFASDIPYGTNRLSRTGIEETVVDGAILLSAVEEGFERKRYLEVYKLRNTAHLTGRHNMEIGRGGITIYPRYAASGAAAATPTRLRRRAKRARSS